ncbi:hypothetical protein GLW36_08475 [Halorubrum terrestre]|uniref:Uncharacterized protein n=1 Tax=Halorubrum distributum TaxID=29283 RepID=A0A6B1INM9_9EURY|nr:hypothetical protein [Halorubrum terrestre]MYL16684.1 hypothetical protein [Halorubrum terrestre]
MGLRCLLGHDFGEPELQREREEEGDEVVTTVKEVKTCARCGETQIVSENTEVTTMEQLADEAAANAAGGGDADAAATPEVGSGPGPTERTPGSASGGVDADDAASGTGGVTLDEEPEAGSDDAVILDDDAGDEAPETAAGASPEGSDAPGSATERPDTAGGSDAAGGAAPADEDAELLDAGEDSASASSASAVSSPTDDAPESASGETDAESDDGVILDEDGEDADDRERGAWPSVDEADADADGSTAWPDHGGEDEGFSAEVGEGGDAGVEFGGGLTPEAAEERGEEGEETEYVEAPDDAESVAFDAGDEGETGITRGESPDLETVGDDGPTEYYCPECGMVRAADGSSMRAGDICPECKRGYVDERPQ